MGFRGQCHWQRGFQIILKSTPDTLHFRLWYSKLPKFAASFAKLVAEVCSYKLRCKLRCKLQIAFCKLQIQIIQARKSFFTALGIHFWCAIFSIHNFSEPKLKLAEVNLKFAAKLAGEACSCKLHLQTTKLVVISESATFECPNYLKTNKCLFRVKKLVFFVFQTSTIERRRDCSAGIDAKIDRWSNVCCESLTSGAQRPTQILWVRLSIWNAWIPISDFNISYFGHCNVVQSDLFTVARRLCFKPNPTNLNFVGKRTGQENVCLVTNWQSK